MSIRITTDQLDRLRADRARAFRDRMVLRLTTDFAPELAHHGVDDATAMVEDGMAAAKTYGLTRRGSVRRFLETMAILGPGFHEEEDWARDTLRDPVLSQTTKMDRIAGAAIFSDRRMKR